MTNKPRRWYQRPEAWADRKLEIKVGQVQVMRMMFERFGMSVEEVQEHFNSNPRHNFSPILIKGIKEYQAFPEIKALGKS